MRGAGPGAAAAVEQLAGKGVSGIVLATSGSHVGGAVEAAASAGVPVLLPYETDPGRGGGGGGAAGRRGPPGAGHATAGAPARTQAEGPAPFVIDAGGRLPSTVSPAKSCAFADGSDTRPMTDALSAAAAEQSVDSVVVAGDAHAQATVVQAIEGTGSALPIILTSQALSSVFPASLIKAGGSLSGNMRTVGVADSDPMALAIGDRAEGLSAFLGAIRFMVDDSERTDLFGAEAFGASSARSADPAAHDAVVALVRAAGAAGSGQPDRVAGALASLSLASGDGIAGAGLTFSGQTALDPSSVVALTATSQDPGLRTLPGGGIQPDLFWFAA